MKRLKAFLCALCLFVILVTGVHLFTANRNLTDKSGNFRYWFNPYKDRCAEALSANMDDDTMPIFGSSELGHERNSSFYIRNMFEEKDVDGMIIGQAFSQDLTHATTLGAIAPSVKYGKVMLMISPSWFFGNGVTSNEFSLRFSDSCYIGMLQNPNLSKETKTDIAKRTLKLLKKDPKATRRVKAYNAAYLEDSPGLFSRMAASLYKSYSHEQETAALFMAEKSRDVKDTFLSQGKSSKRKAKVPGGSTPDWSVLREEALKRTASKSTNPMGMSDAIWNQKFKPKYQSSKTLHNDTDMTKSKEFYDLELFLRVAKEQNLDVCLVIQPINGKWYDYTGLSPEKRNEFQSKLRALASVYGAQITDLSSYDYEPGVFSDAVHPWEKGWVILDEAIYNYYKAS